jgi:hypothetical protein
MLFIQQNWIIFKEKWFIHFPLHKDKSKRLRENASLSFFHFRGPVQGEMLFSQQKREIFKEKWFIHISLSYDQVIKT